MPGRAGVDGVGVEEEQAARGRVLGGAAIADGLHPALDRRYGVLAVRVRNEVMPTEGRRHQPYVVAAVTVLDKVLHACLCIRRLYP